MIYYVCPDHPLPSGGTKTLYRHVDLLNAMGRDAAILHNKIGFRLDWFENATQVASGPLRLDPAKDVLVLPEIHGPLTAAIAPGVPKVIFNQNSHYTFRFYPIPPTEGTQTPYRDAPDILGTMVLTTYCKVALQMTFPEHPVHVVRHGIDPAVFPLVPKVKKQIAFMPRKHGDEAQQVFGWLHFSGALKGWNVVAIDGASEKETSRILQESLVFFAFGYPEGGTLPPFEAASTGCVVVGYGGHSSDFDLAQTGYLVRSSDTTEFAQLARRVLTNYSVEGLVEKGQRASRHIRSAFSLASERTDLETAMKAFGL